MTDEFKDMWDAISGETLSDSERSAMRARLRMYMTEHPVRIPFTMRISDAFSAFLSPSHAALQFASAAVAFVAIAGTGTAYAAGNSLPGEPLYGFKINLEEPIQGAFALSAEAQATWNAQLAARRLSEAEQLAVKNQLTPAAASAVTSGLDQATENFDANVAELATSSSNAATAANLESNMEATLTANTQVLSAIQSAVPSAAPSIQPLLTRVKTRAEAVSTARTQLDIAAASSSTTIVKAAAEQQLTVAEGQLNGSSAVDASSTASNSSGTQTEQAMQAGQQSLNNGNYGVALATFQTVAVAAQEANITATAIDQLATAGVQITTSASSTIAVTATSSESTAISSVATSTSESATTTATSTGLLDGLHKQTK